MLADQVEAGEIDEHVREQIGALEQEAGQARHDLAGALDARRREQRERAAQPAGGEHGVVGEIVVVCEAGQAGVAHVGVDDRDGRAGEVAQGEAELDRERRHRDVIVGGHEADRTRAAAGEAARDPRRLGAHLRIVDHEADRGEQLLVRIAIAVGVGGHRDQHGIFAPVNIVHVLSSYGVGGQERVALDLAAGQVARGHRVSVVSLAPPPDGPLAAEFAAAGVETLTIAKGRGIDPRLVPRLARAFRARGAEIVHTHNPQPMIYGAPAARLAGARAIHSKHGRNPATRAQWALRRAAAQCVHRFVAVSETTAQQARARHEAPAGRIVVIPNGIRLEKFRRDPAARSAVRSELAIPQDAWVIATVGRIDDNKNQQLLVRAAAPLLGPGVHLVLVGDGPARAELEAAVRAIGAPAQFVHVLGRRMDVARLFSGFDVFALSSISEGLPLVVPEAMASELPIIATAVGGLPDIIQDGLTGLLCRVDESELRSRLESLTKDRSRARGLGTAAREASLSKFSADRMIDDYLRLYVGELSQ